MIASQDRIVNVVQKVPTWSSLNSLGKSKTLKSSYIWIVVVPLVAKLFSKIESTIDFTLFGAKISVNLSLPFSWQMFYFSALFNKQPDFGRSEIAFLKYINWLLKISWGILPKYLMKPYIIY